MAEDPVIEIRNLNKTFYVREKPVRSIREVVLNFSRLAAEKHKIEALKGVTFQVNRGEVIGIIGRNGSGKSTLLSLIMGSMKPDKGSFLKTEGTITKLTLGMGFDPNLSARHNIYVNGSILGLTFKTIGNIFWDIIGFADLDDFVDTPIRYYSTGMKTRLAFSIAVHADADVFLLDEIVGGVGDENFKMKSQQIFKDAFLSKRTILFVSHSMKNIKEFSDKVLVLDKGKQIMFGDPHVAVQSYLNLVSKETSR
ncbi:MAG: ATP-binding cassette domain-containing protein [Saprospiraceae bacterium]|nr:ATP-binding cassette domain-containing protein [Saprospiraceae bacterium]